MAICSYPYNTEFLFLFKKHLPNSQAQIMSFSLPKFLSFPNFFKPKSKKITKKPRSKTQILEQIISPGVIYCPAALDDPSINHELVRLFTNRELIEIVLGTNPPEDISNLEAGIFWNDYLEQVDKYFAENPDKFDSFNINDLSTLPTLEALINSGQIPIQIPNIGGALETLPPPLIVLVDPPRYDISSGRINVNLNPPLLTNNIPDINLTAEKSSQIIDISELFIVPKGGDIEYKVISYDDEILNVNLQDNKLYIEALPKTGESKVTIQATTETGEIATHTFSVFNNYVAPESLATINSSLAELQNFIDAKPENLSGIFHSDEAGKSLDSLRGIAAQNPELIQLLATPEKLTDLGLDNSSVATLQQLLQSQELANEFDSDIPLGEALSQPDSRIFDKFLLNGNDAVSLLPDNAKQPKIGFIDFTQDNHIQQVRNTFASVNPLAKHKSFKVRGGNWASQLVKFVDKLKRAGENHGIANLSFDLSQRDDVSVTTRYELTPAEQQAIQYARDNNVLLVVASGNTGDVMSALGQASLKFDNIISVGSINHFESRAEYSAYGEGLNLMAPGGTWQDDPKAFVGTSRATAYVSGAASLVWAANPELSFQQVKQLLIDTAADLDVPGWDAQTGAGLVDIKEAISRAPFVEPQNPNFSQQPNIGQPFSGEGRVKILARPASPGTEAVIQQLQNTQETLLEQWDVLVELGNPLTNLPELKSELEGKITEALEKYRQVSTDAGITTTQAQQWAEALALATQHYQIEQGRLLALQARQQELEELLATFGEQKSALEAETQQLLAGIKEEIARAKSDVAEARAKLTNPFADADDNLQTNSQPWHNAAAVQQQQVNNFRQQATALAGESQNYQARANSINPTRWQVVGRESGRSGRTKEIWGWGQNPQLVKQKNQNQWLASITAQNSQFLQQLAGQTEQQAAALKQYGNFLDDRKDNLAFGSGSTEDGTKVLQLLQQQTAQKQALANKYFQQANIAEQQRTQSKNLANHHNGLINRREVVGTKRTGRSGRNVENVYGWRHYPEHIAPRDRAQQLANEANARRQMYAQLGQQAQQQADILREQGRKLQERLRDWPVLKEGIDYEIAADKLRLQANKDLLAMHDPVQEQKLETLNLSIALAEAELQRLIAEKLPDQQKLTDATEQRLLETQSEMEEIQAKRAEAQSNLQNFLETAGFLLPYRERLTAVEKTIQQLEDEKLRIEETMQLLTVALLQTPSDTLTQQLDEWQNYWETITLELDWANLQKDQLALAVADSPERLAIASLIQDLEAAKGTTIADNIPVEQYLDFLQGIEGSGANFLEGFDNLEQRLAAAETEKVQAQESLGALYDEYRDLGLQKAELVDNQILPKENEIEVKELEISGTEEAIAQTYDSLNVLENQLTQTENARTAKADEIQQQEAVVAQTQGQITDVQNQIAAKNSEIQEQQSVAQGYQNQINQAYAVANHHEQQRQSHQNAANYWNERIQTWGVVGHQRQGKRNVPIYGWVHNPQAEANRNAHQAAANNAAQQRDAATVQAQQLSVSLQPEIAITQEEINKLNQEKQPLIEQQQALQNQLTDQQATQQQLQQELETIVQQLNAIEANIQQEQQKVDGLNNQLQQQEQELDVLNSELNNLNQQLSLLEQQLIDKYREIEIINNYLSQVEGEINRLDSRLELLKQAGIYEQQYQENWQQWQTANQARTTATEALITIRQAGASDRSTLASLQTQLTQTQTNLDEAKILQESLTNTQKALAFNQLQLGNQHLLLRSLVDRDAPLAAAQQYYANLAEQSRQRIWANNRYNPSEASAYRAYLQQASFIADQRNKAWQQRQQAQTRIGELHQQIAQQQAEIGSQQQQLANLGSIAQLEAQVANINSQINTVNQRLQPLQIQENQHTQAIAAADAQMQNLATELVQTAQLQGDALRQLVGFGILASESDVDFFITQVEPNVNTSIEQLRARDTELTAQVENAKVRTANAEQELANSTDETSKQALTNLIEQLQEQQTNLEELTAQNQQAADELENLLNQANAALTPLRQKQEVEIRQKLNSNYKRLSALESQLNSDNAAKTARETDTVQNYVQLTNQIRQDLTDNATNWTEQLLASHQQTKELGNSQENLSESVDEFIDYITGNLADPDGEYNRSEANLRDGITTLGVVESRADELDSSVTSVDDAIEKLKLRSEQDEKLWEEIAPIAIRYGVESQELADYLATPGDEKTRRAAFLAKYPDNGTAVDLLTAATLQGNTPNEEIARQVNATNPDVILNANAVEGRNPLQGLYDKAKAEESTHTAQGHALLGQAAWHEQQAAYHWARSRKNGPTWSEWRRVCSRKWTGKKKCRNELVTHTDHHWIAWRNHSQLFPQLRQQGTANLAEADKWRKVKERLEPLKNQWVEANNAANEAHPAVKEARNLFAELEAARSDIPQAQTQLEIFEELLPTLRQQLEEAEAEAKAQNAKVKQQWQEYDTDSEEYRAAVADILERRGELNKQAIETQQQIAESELWVERQSVALSEELAGVEELTTNLQKEQQENEQKINDLVAQGLTTGLDDLNTKKAQIEQSLPMLTNKAAVLTSQQTALTQKRTLLTAQNEVILAEQRLLDAYIKDPDADTSNLKQQLQDAREALAEAQRLAEQAEKASQALTAPLQQLKTDLLLQNDQHLQAARENQEILRALVEATQSNANYTVQLAQKQQQVNDLELQIMQRLQTVTDAGYHEAKHLLDVAKYNDIATAAEIYYRDYDDLASDKGSSSAGGLARPEDRILADRYYREMLHNRELQRRAQAQADAFGRAKETAQAQMQTLQAQQANAQQILNELNAKVAETQAEREQKQQELAIAQARLDGITRIREQTEQTFIHLVTIEQLNLAQAQLEQEIAQNREAEIDAAVEARQERDRLELERKRLETQARIEHLQQLQAEDDLRQNLNQVRGSVGLDDLEATENQAQLQTQLAGLLTNLENLETNQPDLPDDVKALLAEARGDIHLALQGKEAENIQENLLTAMDGLIGQIEQYKTEINRIDLEEQLDTQLLQEAESDLQGASRKLLKELERSGDLSEERDVIDPLYLEVLNKVALAEQAVDISEDLAQQSRGILEQIIDQRIAQRKARKKAFWNELLGVVSGVIGIVGTILSFTPLAPLGIGLTAASAGINGIQSIMNGDWMGGIFNIVMAGVNAVTAGMGNALSQGTKLAIQGLQSVASSAFSSARSIMSGDNIMGFLQILGGVAGAVTSGLSNVINQASSTIQQTMLQVFNSLQNVPQMIYGSIKSIENGDWFSAIGGIFNSVVTLGTNFAGVFDSTAAKLFEYLGKAGNTALAVGGAIKEGSIEGWLSGINSVIGLWGDDIKNLIDRLNGEPRNPIYEYEDGKIKSCSSPQPT